MFMEEVLYEIQRSKLARPWAREIGYRGSKHFCGEWKMSYICKELKNNSNVRLGCFLKLYISYIP